MASDNIKDFSINLILYGLLFVALSTFTVIFISENNTNAISPELMNLVNGSSSESQSRLVELNEESNVMLNITSYTDPEASYLGSKDQVATAYKMTGSAKRSWESSKSVLSVVIQDPKIIIIFSSIILFSMVYFILKFLRTGY